MHQRKGNALGARANTARQVAARQGAALFAVFFGPHTGAKRAAGNEVARQLVFQVDAVRHHHHAAFLQGLDHQQRFGQEHHGEALARARGVPDHTTLARTVGFELADTRHQRPDAKKLLVTRHDLAHLAVEQHKAVQQLQQSRGRQQADQQTVLVRRQHGLRPERLEVIAKGCRFALEQSCLQACAQWPVLDGGEMRLVE